MPNFKIQMSNKIPNPNDKKGDFSQLRERMVNEQLVSRGISDMRVLAAFRKVPREEFVPSFVKPSAYIDAPLSIGQGQTISQSYTVALMTELLELEPHNKVLEIGTGSGYQAAILAELVDNVYSIERIPELAEVARDNLVRLSYGSRRLRSVCRGTASYAVHLASGADLRGAIGLRSYRKSDHGFTAFRNVAIRVGDGSQGWPEEAPFDRITITAAAPKIPEPLLEQLAEGGRLVAPVGGQLFQEMVRLTRRGEEFRKETFGTFRFVPLISD